MTPTQLFTADQANRMLPLVRRIVADIVDHYRRWEDLVDAFEIAAADSRADRQSAEAERLQREAQRTAEDIEGFRRELAGLGVECKAFDVGLVDFPAEIAGRPVYLCWRLGEPAVQYWHERGAGYAGRHPLAVRAA